MPNLYKLEKVDKENVSDDYWQRIYDYLKKCTEIRGVDFKEKPLSGFRSHFLLWLNNGAASYLVWKNDKAAGSFGLDFFRKDSLGKRQIFFHNHLIDLNLDNEILTKIFECFLGYDVQAQYFYIKSEDGKNDFIPSKLAVEAYEFRKFYELNISTLNKEELLNDLNFYRRKYSDYRLKFYEILPDELLEPYCKLYTKLIKAIPSNPEAESYNLEATELKTRQESSIKNEQYELRYLLYDQSDKLIGLTGVGLNKNYTKVGYQHMTGIAKDYRRRGLAKYLKLEMFLKLMNSYPNLKKLETEINQENEISIKMNESMGYKEKGHRKIYLISRKRIENWLSPTQFF